jgi:hypothetical protein
MGYRLTDVEVLALFTLGAGLVEPEWLGSGVDQLESFGLAKNGFLTDHGQTLLEHLRSEATWTMKLVPGDCAS